MKLPILIDNSPKDFFRPEPVTVCGGCTECCYAVAVEEVNKPYFRHCKHQKSSRCGIYKDRPKSCAAYTCLYLTGFTADSDNELDQNNCKYRPDHLGFIFQGYKDTVTDEDGSNPRDATILEIIETRDCGHESWKRMNVPLNNVLRQLRFDAIKLFCYDTIIGTTFHTEPVDMYQCGDKRNWAQTQAPGFPPMFIFTETKNPSSLAKIAVLLGDSKPKVMPGMDALKRKLGIR